MSAPKYLMDIIRSNNLELYYINVINIFRNSDEEYLDIDYFLITKKLNRESIYSLFNILIEFGVIEVVEFTKCNSCYNEVKVNYNNHFSKCDYCKSYLDNEYIVDRYRLIK